LTELGGYVSAATRMLSCSKYTNLSKILKCTDYCGEITVNRSITDVKGRVLGTRPESEHIVFDAPPLITQDRTGGIAKPP
jgi:hypothetical protein